MNQVENLKGERMKVVLKDMKPNPKRDFQVDPIDEDRVEALKTSIRETGFWGGVVCRRNDNGEIEIAAGHTRIRAALELGIETADLFVSEDMDDATIIRIYALENGTQRGFSGTAQVGSVASAIRFLAKIALGGGCREFATRMGSEYDWETIRGNLTSKRGIGQPIISEKFLKGVPGINEHSVRDALSILKDSGNYARIIHEVQEEIEAENKAAAEELERATREREEAEERARQAEEARKEASRAAKEAKEDAAKKKAELERQKADVEAKLAEKRRKEAEAEMEKFEALKEKGKTAAAAASKAATASNNKPKTFDFEGVSQYLKDAHHIEVFRKTVTGDGIKPYLPFENQAALAKHLFELARQRKVELTGAFIRENVVTLILGEKEEVRKLTKEQRERLSREDMILKAKDRFREFISATWSQVAAGKKIMELQRNWPEGATFPVTNEFDKAIKEAKKVIDQLYEFIHQKV